MNRKFLRLVACVILGIAPLPGLAHSGGASYVELDASRERILAQIDLPLPDLATELALDADGDGALRWGEVLDAAPRIATTLQQRLQLRAAGGVCDASLDPALQIAQRDTGRHLRVVMHYDCGGSMPQTLDASRWLQQLPDQGIYVSRTDSSQSVALLAGSLGSLALSASGGGNGSADLAASSARFLLLGAEHLLSGYDHLAFLALLLLGTLGSTRRDGGLRAVLLEAARVVTAFTAAHSITLALAATGLVRLPVAPIEAAIAGSIVLTAAALLWSSLRRTPSRAYGWPLAFGFGLVHGLGFANVLAELLSGTNLVRSLLAFNVGIEIAQLGLVLAALPILWLLGRRPQLARYLTPALALGIGALASVWLVERVT